MKPILILLFLCLHSISFSQITFEEVANPVDFNIGTIRKSPAGEYLMQAMNDRTSVYSSFNGTDWTKQQLPNSTLLNEIQFFSDGTPVLQPETSPHLIRRNGSWHEMDVPGAYGSVESSFIKDDSLFVYQDKNFAVSVDKGQTFKKLFSFSLIDHTTHIYKFEHNIVLHHTAGSTDSLSVFNESGQRILKKEMDDFLQKFLFNSCGEILFLGNSEYYLLKEQGLAFSHGTLTSLHPQYDSEDDFWAEGEYFYLRAGNNVLKTNGCNFIWDLLTTEVPAKESFWVSAHDDILLWDQRSDSFTELLQGSTSWYENKPDINYALVASANESSDNQAILTSNAIFTKNIHDTDWMRSDTTGKVSYNIQYSPQGNLYINRYDNILFSADNGKTFRTIPLPVGLPFFFGYRMEILDDNVIFLSDDLLFQSAYTVNNGRDWNFINLPSTIDPPQIKLIDNYILVANLDDYHFNVSRINMGTNEITSEDYSDFFQFDFSGSVITDDGSIYFEKYDNTGSSQHGLFRYIFGSGIEFLGLYQEFSNFNTLLSSGNELFFFGASQYFHYDGEKMNTYPYAGIPSILGTKSFIVTQDEYLYVILNTNRIFRSTQPLTYPKYITGSVYSDSNKDCSIDTSDSKLNYWQIKVENEKHLRIGYTNYSGHFKLSVPDGDYTLSSQPLNENWDLCTESHPVKIDDQHSMVNEDFLAVGLSSCAELELDFSSPLLRRCFTNYYSFRVRNTGPEASAGTTFTLELDPFFEFVSATIPYTIINDSTINFNLGVLAVNDQITFEVFFNISCEAALGMEHCLHGTLNDANECGDTRSSYTECQHNIGSYDPNDKRIFNEEGREVQSIDKGEYIYYHIRFQNTGTDTAFRVRILDPLSPKMDLSTLEMLSASHPYEYSITDGPALEVDFKNILLPDSTTNEPASHGYFKFRVKPLPLYDYGTIIPNQAGIYFDFNDPVFTNEATFTILPHVGTKESEEKIAFSVLPNPATKVLTLKISDSDLLRIDTYEIINQTGQVVVSAEIGSTHEINIASLASGAYCVLLKNKGHLRGMKKFIKL